MIHELDKLLVTSESREPSRGNERDGRSSLWWEQINLAGASASMRDEDG
jgi:hypothetical protein